MDVPECTIVRPTYLAIHLTYTCPATCDHCCFSSSPSRKEKLSKEQVLAAIESVASIKSIKVVGFTGGEPFLMPSVLEAAIKKATSLGFITRVVTSCAWAKEKSKSYSILKSLKENGLKEISISYDDSHSSFIKEEHLINCIEAAVTLNLRVAINICVEPACIIDKMYIANLLNQNDIDTSKLIIAETIINNTGRAEYSNERTLDKRKQLGSCGHILRGPTITATGKYLPCCGTIPFREGLSIGKIETGSITDALKNSYSNLLYKWIAFEGPAAILEQVTRDEPLKLSSSAFDGNCNACDVLVHNPHCRTPATCHRPPNHLHHHFLTSLPRLWLKT